MSSHQRPDGLSQILSASSADLFAEDTAQPSRWMLPYADVLTLLLGIFIVFYGLHTHEKLAAKPTVVQQPTPAIALLAIAEPTAQSSMFHWEASRGWVATLPEAVLFQPGESDLSPESARTLDAVAQVLSQTTHSISVEGYTDDTPIQSQKTPSNWELSTLRSINIIHYLTQHDRLDPKRFRAVGYGEYHPVAKNSTSEGKRKNRRVDIVVMMNPTTDRQNHG